MFKHILFTVAVLLTAASVGCAQSTEPSSGNPPYKPATLLIGPQALATDWHDDVPGIAFWIRLADLPKPYVDPPVSNGPKGASQPNGAWPQVPAGFAVDKVLGGLNEPRKIITAPNGDLFLAESGGNQIRVIRQTGSAAPTVKQVFVGGLDQPFGLAFYPPGPNPQYLYVANTNDLRRFPYHNGDLTATGPGETLIRNIANGGGGHWTRDIVFSSDGQKLFLAVGSGSNVCDNLAQVPIEQRRARIFQYNPDGTGEQVYAYGIRNPVGITIDPSTNELWMSVNERDNLGNNLVPDYISHVEPNGFYGWPWYWMGGTVDTRAVGDHPDLSTKVITPDVLLQAHSASLCITFYHKGQFPKDYDGDAFACEHGSWNRAVRTGYKVIRVLMKDGRATGVYEDFMTGFVVDNSSVWGRPVGVTEGADGSLYVTDDGSDSLWHIRYVGQGKQAHLY
jgi:glucose/arabinose dehydrogenase